MRHISFYLTLTVDIRHKTVVAIFYMARKRFIAPYHLALRHGTAWLADTLAHPLQQTLEDLERALKPELSSRVSGQRQVA